MEQNPIVADKDLSLFLARHQSIGGWRAEWDGVPLEARICLSGELPPLEFIGSVRAIVLRGADVLIVHSSPPHLVVGGRREPGEKIEQTLVREVGEESGWIVRPVAVIGFVHTWHLDEQRPDWNRPAPDFIDPIFVAEAVEYDAELFIPGEVVCEFVPVSEVKSHGIEEINLILLTAATTKNK